MRSDTESVSLLLSKNKTVPDTVRVMASFPNTLDLTRVFRQSFVGPMIGMSSEPKNLKLLREAGCDYEAEKDEAVNKLLEVLDL